MNLRSVSKLIAKAYVTCASLWLLNGCAGVPEVHSWLIQNAVVIDGTGAPSYRAHVRVADQRIVEIGQLTLRANEHAIDAKGLVLAPGFIDTHSHADADLPVQPQATAATSQGITTVVFGQDGESALPLAALLDQWRAAPAAVNIASYSGHNSIRYAVMGDDFKRVASKDEIASMKHLLRADLEAGALGLATGLEYDPGLFSSSEEVVELATLASQYGGRYISHIRSEDRYFKQAIDEIISIGKQSNLPVHISHLKLAMTTLWGETPWLLRKLDAARAGGVDITADVYPYEYWQSTLEVLFPERDFTDIKAARQVLSTLAPADGLLMSKYLAEPALVGQTIAYIAAARGISPEQTLLDMIADAQQYSAQHQLDDGSIISSEAVIGTSMHSDDVAQLILWEHSNVCTDGGLIDRHPRAIGSFPRVLRWLVREEKRMSLEQAVHKMTQQAANNVGIRQRGVIEPGAYADLVLFDPSTVSDRATPQQPHLQSVGIERVWVNGRQVFAGGASTPLRPGMLILRASAADLKDSTP